jgi:hypothetical protein
MLSCAVFLARCEWVRNYPKSVDWWHGRYNASRSRPMALRVMMRNWRGIGRDLAERWESHWVLMPQAFIPMTNRYKSHHCGSEPKDCGCKPESRGSERELSGFAQESWGSEQESRGSERKLSGFARESWGSKRESWGSKRKRWGSKRKRWGSKRKACHFEPKCSDFFGESRG